MAIYHNLMSKEYIELTNRFKVNPKRCDNPGHYEMYIKQDCFTDQKQGMGVTHVFVDEENGLDKAIAGYITLRGSSLIMESGDKYKLGFPALEISELAVNTEYEGRGLGTDMVKFAINEAVELNETTMGFQYVILCADVAAVDFYKNSNLNFKPIRQMQEIPREHRNSTCKPMMLKVVQNN